MGGGQEEDLEGGWLKGKKNTRYEGIPGRVSCIQPLRFRSLNSLE